MILSEAISLAKERLKDIYSKDEINVIAMMLCEHLFSVNRIEYYTSSKQTSLTKSKVISFIAALDKLQQYCPIQYVVGEAAFYGLTFKVNPNVLIPRPETEELVDWICKDYKINDKISILDIGTGSGVIAVTLAKYFSSASITAIDISPDALNVASTNASLNNVSVLFLKEDIFSPSPKLIGQKFDVIVSNPPYVRESEKKHMGSNVLSYEPTSALFVPDNNALKYYQTIADFASYHLSENGAIYLEINEDLASETSALFSIEKYGVTLREDLNGKDRMLKIIRR